MFIQNDVPLPESEDSQENVDADYEKIPISEFGLAFLRGYGWKKEEGIGKTNRKAVELRIFEARPKGLGLGAKVPSAKLPKGIL